MHDREIVAAIVAGDPVGLAAAYDTYAQQLYAFCQSMLTEPADAADAVQDTFIVASAKVSGLREPDHFRAWLFAVARNECHRRLRARARASSAPLDEAAETADDAEDPEADADHAELRALVLAALGGLNPGEREIVELNLRNKLAGGDLADVLGVSRNQAHALASRARSQFETSLGALLVARWGRAFSPDLAGILDGWDGQLTVLLRKRVNRHIERCEVCGERKCRELSPAMLLGLLPVAMLPASLREQIVHLVADITQGSLAYHARVVHRAGTFTGSGFPAQVSSPPPVHLPANFGRAAGATGATVAAGALLGGVLLFVPHPAGPPAAVGPQPGSCGSPGGGSHASASPSGPQVRHRAQRRSHGHGSPPRRPHPAPAAPGTGPAPASAVPAASGPASQPSAPSSSAPSSSAPSSSAPLAAVQGTLGVSPTRVQVGLTITLTAEGGPVNYSITAPAVLAVSPSSGSLQAGSSVTVTVGLGLGQILSGNVTLTVNPGSIQVVVVPLPIGVLSAP